MTDAVPPPPELPPLDDLLATARVVSLPLATRFRGIDAREALLMEGPAGWTEFSPFAEYSDAEAAAWLAAAIDYGWMPQPEPRREWIPVNATVPAVAAASVPGILARFEGCRTAKVKVAEPGQRLADDVARVRAVRETLGEEGRIRVDANGGWNVDEAEHAIHALAEYDLEYVEQPCASVEELGDVRRRVKYMGIPIAADESVRRAEDPLAVAAAGAADILIVKAQPLGGVRRALELIALAELPAVVSSALDTSIGLSMGAALAAALARARLRLRPGNGIPVPRRCLRQRRFGAGRRQDRRRKGDPGCRGAPHARGERRPARLVAGTPAPLSRTAG